MQSEKRQCQNCKQSFTIEPEDFSFYEKIGVPVPTWCPYCRFIRRVSFINGRSLYKGICEQCKKSIVSMYHNDTKFPVWCVKCHFSDIWDGRDYGVDYDFSINFFQQFSNLKNAVPHRALDQNEMNGEGCEYSNLCYTSKNVYLSYTVIGCENIKYSSNLLKRNKDCVDCLLISANNKGYELVQARENYNSTFLVESDLCIDSHFLFDCSNCTNCCLSSNLRNKSFVLKNKQLSKEEYEEKIKSLKLNTYKGQQEAKKEFNKIFKEAIHKYANIKNSVNAIGDFIENSKNVSYCYGVIKAENVKNIYFSVNTLKDSQDAFFVGKSEECYEFTLSGRGASKVVLSLSCGGGCKNVFYSDSCRGCSDCFGCINLINQKYCIFNKQYSKEDYFKAIEKIKIHMNEMPFIDKTGKKYVFGEFFPPEISPFCYNETIAFQELPLSKQETISLGLKWRDFENKSYVPTIESKDLPECIEEVEDSICKEIIECPNKGKTQTQCTSAFKILPDELAFYRQMNLPLPRFCPNCRYYERLVWKNPFKFYKRKCMCNSLNHNHKGDCQNEFITMYSPEKPEIIYCKECYNKEVY